MSKRQSRKIGKIGYKKQDEDKPNKKYNTIRVGHHFTQLDTNNANKT